MEALSGHLKEGSRALDIGSGTGYLTACFAIMVGKTGKAIGIEHIEDFVKMSINNINNWNPNVLPNGSLKILGILISVKILIIFYRIKINF